MFIELILTWLIKILNVSFCLINLSFAQRSELIWSQTKSSPVDMNVQGQVLI